MTKRVCKMKNWKVFLLLSLFFCILLVPSYESQAAPATGTVKNRILNVRTTASTSSAIVCKLSQGTSVTISSETTGTDGMKWYKVSFAKTGGATEGYVRGDLLNVSGTVSSSEVTSSSGSQTVPATKDGDTVYVNASAVRVRKEASESSKIVANLLKGDSGEQIKTKKGDDGKQWTKVSFTINDTEYKGYIRSDLLTASNPGGSGDSDDEILYVNASAVRVRKEASESSKIVANLLQGDSVKLKKTKTGDDGKQWSKVSFTINDTKYQGYIRSDLLSASKSGSASTSAPATENESDSGDKMLYVNYSSVRVREEASTTSAIVAGLGKGTQVKEKKTKTGADGKQWTKVSFTYNGTKTYGYIRSDLLSEVQSGSQTSNIQTGTAASGGKKVRPAAVNVRSSASATSAIKATLTQGSSVTVLSETTGTNGKKWSKVSCTYNGKTVEGYIRSDLLN